MKFGRNRVGAGQGGHIGMGRVGCGYVKYFGCNHFCCRDLMKQGEEMGIVLS